MPTIQVGSLPIYQTYFLRDGGMIKLQVFLRSLRPTIEALMQAGRIKKTDSFGFAMTEPQWQGNRFDADWDNPNVFTWFTGGWGPHRERYIANAVRKLRPLIREDQDSTLFMRYNKKHLFRDVVPSVDDNGHYPWGDFAHGGAVKVQTGPLTLRGSISCFKAIEDDAATRFVLGLLSNEILTGDDLLPALF